MSRLARLMAVALVAAAAAAPGAAWAASTDSHAPEDAPPHWLPPEAWVYNHWLPYNEGRLYRLLDISRAQLWQQLRDDRRSVAQVARRRGWRAGRLASALVAPWRGRVPASRVAELRRRALLTITQGHLAQHLFFHSLHQFAIASEAPDIFGVSDAAFRDLRRTLELSPLTIARLHGRSPARVEALSVAVLRERLRAGVAGHALTRRQARILLRRQITQLPRWLGQARYNGPPKTHRGKLLAKPQDYASNPTVTTDGSQVVFEQYRQRLPSALRLGEIAVVSHDLRTGASTLVSRPRAPQRERPLDPASAYNASASGDGRLVAYESSAGNVNFAKRYGRIRVLLTDLGGPSTVALDDPPRGSHASQSAYNPVVAAGGRHVAFQAVRGAGQARIFVRDLLTGATRLASTGLPRSAPGTFTSIYEPGLSADGRFAIFTAVTGALAGGLRSTSSQVYVRDLATGTTTPASARGHGAPAARGGFSSDGAISGDGRYAAFTSTAPGLVPGAPATAAPRLFVRDLQAGTTTAITAPDAGAAVEPELSADGRTIAYTLVRDGVGRVFVEQLDTGATTLASRADGPAGTPAQGSSGDPSLSADGTVVAFASDAANLDRGKADATRGVFVRDLRAATTTLVSRPSTAPRVAAAAAIAASGGPTVTIRDNAFVRHHERPLVSVRSGTVVTWRWRSQSSHNVTVRSGPARFRSPTKSRGSYARRLERRGAYRLVCTLHAPGMRMRVDVR